MNSDLGDTTLAIVTPMANEAADAVDFVRELLKQVEGFRQVRHFVVLDNASKDSTRTLLEEYAETENRLQVVWAPENRSVFDAYMRGYREALATGFDWVLEIDAGFSHRPDDLPGFLEKMTEDYDCVFGTRFALGGTMEAPLGRRVSSRGGTMLTNLLLGTKLSDMTSGYQAFRGKALEGILAKEIAPSTHFFQTEMKVHARSLSFAEVPIQYSAPSDNVKGSTVFDSLRLLGRLFIKRLKGQL